MSAYEKLYSLLEVIQGTAVVPKQVLTKFIGRRDAVMNEAKANAVREVAKALVESGAVRFTEIERDPLTIYVQADAVMVRDRAALRDMPRILPKPRYVCRVVNETEWDKRRRGTVYPEGILVEGFCDPRDNTLVLVYVTREKEGDDG
jgi:hypothetical protein|tara:strand:- start:28232 stop:28672 length:441 start_codon:yes stop_codon:yes gene_type:complete